MNAPNVRLDEHCTWMRALPYIGESGLDLDASD
jgi:hypothetical protein